MKKHKEIILLLICSPLLIAIGAHLWYAPELFRKVLKLPYIAYHMLVFAAEMWLLNSYLFHIPPNLAMALALAFIMIAIVQIAIGNGFKSLRSGYSGEGFCVVHVIAVLTFAIVAK
jgi:hypothetical protein